MGSCFSSTVLLKLLCIDSERVLISRGFTTFKRNDFDNLKLAVWTCNFGK